MTQLILIYSNSSYEENRASTADQSEAPGVWPGADTAVGKGRVSLLATLEIR